MATIAERIAAKPHYRTCGNSKLRELYRDSIRIINRQRKFYRSRAA